MSTDFKPPNITRIEKLNHDLRSPFEFYLSIGSTFFLVPEITFSVKHGELALDWLWFHCGFLHYPRKPFSAPDASPKENK